VRAGLDVKVPDDLDGVISFRREIKKKSGGHESRAVGGPDGPPECLG